MIALVAVRTCRLAIAAILLVSSLHAEVANNPGITITGGITGSDVLCTGSSSSYSGELNWPPGVSHPVPGKYTWSASPTGKATISGSNGPVTNASSLDIDLVSVAGASPGSTTLTVQWKADSGNYSMPSASKTICVINPVGAPTPVSNVTFTRTTVGTNGNFGLTVPQYAVFDISAYTDCSAKTWKCKVTKADCEIGVGIDMLGRSEASVAAATAVNWRTMSEDIAPIELARQWYMRAAIVAHEEVHATGWESLTRSNYAVFQVTVEALTVPMSCSVDTADKAKAAIKALPAYQAALTEFRTNCNTDWVQYNHPAIDAATVAAEQSVLNPVYLGILVKAAQNGWN